MNRFFLISGPYISILIPVVAVVGLMKAWGLWLGVSPSTRVMFLVHVIMIAAVLSIMFWAFPADAHECPVG